MHAIILAGGFGTRLKSVVADLPKAMAPVAGRPFLAFVLDALEDAGFTSVTLAVGYRSEAIRAHFGGRFGSLSLEYSVEATPLGTGGAIRLALERVSAPRVFVLNGDTYIQLDFRAMEAAHVAAGACLSVAVQHVADTGRYGAVEVKAGHIQRFAEKGRSGPGLINAGVYLLDPQLLADYPPGSPFSFEADFVMPHAEELRPRAFAAQGLFIDIGVPDDYALAQRLLGANPA